MNRQIPDEVAEPGEPLEPGTYIHQALLKCQEALIKESVKDGFLQYSVLVDHIMRICRAAELLSKATEESLTKLVLKDDGVVAMAKVANEKLDLILKEVFALRELTAPLKVGREEKSFEELPDE